jgi:DmsE family decaheme c-type cytochrome
MMRPSSVSSTIAERTRRCAAPLIMLLLYAAAAVAGSGGAVIVGEQECRACHRAEAITYLEDRHGRVFGSNPRTPAQAAGCEACHGPGSLHLEVAGEFGYDGPLHIRSFAPHDNADDVNALCLGCHQGGTRIHWQGGAHALDGISCTGCHVIHDPRDAGPTAACQGCHRTQRAMLQRSSHMPIREGRVGCADCHDPHGGIGPASLRTASVNETCYRCHAEMRGPNIFEHPPVREDCTLCHDPHGSNHPALLKRQAPWLCQQCHLSRGHSSRLYQAQDLDNRQVPQLRGEACVNCHSRIHGSNHPSGARFQR